jgi:Putative ER transporter, 6TM, N-terminal
VLPVTLFSAIALLVSITIFPSTISAQFTTRLQEVLSPLVESLELHRGVLKSVPHTEHFAEMVVSIKTLTGQSEANLTSLAASARLLDSDLIYSRFSPEDFHTFLNLARRITARASGMETYFTLIDPISEKFPGTPAPSVAATPLTPATPTSIPTFQSPERNEFPFGAADYKFDNSLPMSPTHRPSYASSSQDTQFYPNLHGRFHGTGSPRLNLRHLPHNLLHRRLLRVSHPRREKAVGVFESQRYLNLEATNFHDPAAKAYTTRATGLLSVR